MGENVQMLGPSVLQQNVSVPTALQEEAAAEQRVVAHLSLPDKPLQVVHVLDGLDGQTENITLQLPQPQQTTEVK